MTIRTSTLCAALLCVAALCATPSKAQISTPISHYTDKGRPVTAQQAAASDELMSAGLSQLQAAASSLQAGNAQAATAALQSAIGNLQQALPIYHGYREHSIHAADNAVKALGENKRKSIEHADKLVVKAIADAQTGLSTPH